jgi:peptide/nickel transport system permease protein
VVDSFEQDFIRTARAKGLSRRRVIWKHAGKSAAPSVITMAGIQLVTLFGGAVVVENVFALPGLGSLTVQSVSVRDMPVLQAIVMVSAIAVVSINLVVDLLVSALYPKARS